jgi:hypothetical protein
MHPLFFPVVLADLTTAASGAIAIVVLTVAAVFRSR